MHIHRYGKWEDQTYEVYRKCHPPFQALFQVKTCKKCNQKKTRQL